MSLHPSIGDRWHLRNIEHFDLKTFAPPIFDSLRHNRHHAVQSHRNPTASLVAPIGICQTQNILLHCSTSPTTTTGGIAPTGCAPGYYLPEITNFSLQLPYGKKAGGSPLEITGAELAGCGGYQNASWFYWDTAGDYMVMKAPPNGTDCAHTSGSLHCRTELREENPDIWSPSGTNTMSVKLKVAVADDGDYGTVIGQVFASYSKPVCELFYAPDGVITLGVEQTTKGGQDLFYQVGTIPINTEFTYEYSYSNNILSLSINGGTPQTFPTSQLGNPNSYFKVGDYDQGKTLYAEVDIYSIAIVHS